MAKSVAKKKVVPSAKKTPSAPKARSISVIPEEMGELLAPIPMLTIVDKEPEVMILLPDGSHVKFASYTDAYNFIVNLPAVTKGHLGAISGHDLQRVHFQV